VKFYLNLKRRKLKTCRVNPGFFLTLFFDWETTEPASVLVISLERGFFNAADALASISAPV
jgi:hypothetical protein